ncbi:GAF and ANTAR domain-containing protein [Lentzea sp.]|uniref:ANTAR domain-containing response regulator n=1 Tax=Lentzea sp. TaxID=56099 RepID=UPI002ED2C983
MELHPETKGRRGMHDSTTAPERPHGDERPDPLTRLDDATDALAVLRDAFSRTESLDAALQRLADTAARVIPDADGVSISIVIPGRPRTVAATDRSLVRIDEEQHEAGRGPGLESAFTLKPVRAAVGERSEEWPEFERAASETGVRAYLSVPLVLPASGPTDAQHVGTLTVHSRTAAAFDPYDEGLVLLFTTAASATITNARRWQRSHAQAQHLEQALHSRATIEQAKGVLMAVHSCSADAAFTMLVERSQNENVKLRDVAGTLIESLWCSETR